MCRIKPSSLKWGIHFDVAGAVKKIDELEQSSQNQEFWNDLEHSQTVLQKRKALKKKVDDYESMVGEYEDLLTLIELGIEETDESVEAEAEMLANEFKQRYEQMRLATLLSGEYDASSAIVTLHSGAGGTESCDWVDMLFRMYSRWAQRHGYSMEVLDYLPGEEAGVKSVTFQIDGENAFGYMKCEKGVHRLVRISPFDSSGRRHTSFASCDVMPELEDDAGIEIDPEELRIDTYRSSGAGGQHVNKTESAIRITHIPTGTVVQCQNERSQHKNRDRAMKMLRAKLHEIQREAQSEKLQDIRGEIKDIAWGSQIRSYVFHPYSMVKDHRTNAETGNVQAVMDGQIDHFINVYLSKTSKRRQNE